MISIGPYTLPGRALLAPMAGVTDRPFRQLCRRFGATLVVSEMVTADPQLWHTRKSALRRDHQGEPEPIAVQIAGTDPRQLADTARRDVDHGAQIIDINMGCPAKKVCQQAAGSALLRDEPRVAAILQAVVAAVNVPVTLKIRTGWCPASRNGVHIARIAEDSGIQALAVHGRTRACAFRGEAEYQTIAEIKAAVSIPIIANGDIDSPQKAAWVLRETGADGVMLGRAAQGKPWIFRQINHYLAEGELLADPSEEVLSEILLEHLQALYEFYGEYMGLRIARKHLGWYLQHHPEGEAFRRRFNTLDSAAAQLEAVEHFFAAMDFY